VLKTRWSEGLPKLKAHSAPSRWMASGQRLLLDVNLAPELGPGMEKDLESDESPAPLRDARFTCCKERGCIPDN